MRRGIFSTRKCSCGRSGAVLFVKLDRNLVPTHALMCSECARRHGYSRITYTRQNRTTFERIGHTA